MRKAKQKKIYCFEISFIVAINASDKFWCPHTGVVATRNIKILYVLIISILAGSYNSSVGTFKTA